MLVISLCNNVFESSSINSFIGVVSWFGNRPEADGWAVVVGICWEAKFEFPLRLWPFVWKTLLVIEFVADVDEDEDDEDEDEATADTTVGDIMLVVGGCNIVAPAVAFNIF